MLGSRKRLICSENSANTGNAVNKVSVMVINGTSDSSVVNVRLAAISAQRSCMKRTEIKRSQCRKSVPFFFMANFLQYLTTEIQCAHDTRQRNPGAGLQPALRCTHCAARRAA